MTNNTNKKRREKINILVTPEERKIISDKAREYGYGDCLAEYVRDACIYEKLYVEDLSGKQDVCKIVSEFILIVKDILKKQTDMSKNITLSKENIETLRQDNVKIIDAIERLSKELITKLSSNSVPKFQKRLRLVEKNKITKKFLEYVSNKKFVIVLPSTLGIKNSKEGFLLVGLDNSETLDIKTLEETSAITIINLQREKALREKCYLFFSSNNNELNIYLADYFKDKEESINKYKEKVNQNSKLKLYSCNTKDELQLKEG